MAIMQKDMQIQKLLDENSRLKNELSKPCVKYIGQGSNGRPISITLRDNTEISINREGNALWLSIEETNNA